MRGRCGRRSMRRRDQPICSGHCSSRSINMKHKLVQLAGKIDWEWIDGEIAPLYSDKGRPGIETRFVIGLLLLKHIYGLSDEGVCERWVHDPYFQHFTGRSSSSTSFRTRALGPEPLAQAAGGHAGAIAGRKSAGCASKRCATDQGPQAGHGRHHGAAQGHHVPDRCQAAARSHQEIEPPGRQTRRATAAVIPAHRQTRSDDAGRYAHANNRHRRELRILRTRLGRIVRYPTQDLEQGRA
jgi:IS5 family transposase